MTEENVCCYNKQLKSLKQDKKWLLAEIDGTLAELGDVREQVEAQKKTIINLTASFVAKESISARVITELKLDLNQSKTDKDWHNEGLRDQVMSQRQLIDGYKAEVDEHVRLQADDAKELLLCHNHHQSLIKTNAALYKEIEGWKSAGRRADQKSSQYARIQQMEHGITERDLSAAKASLTRVINLADDLRHEADGYLCYSTNRDVYDTVAARITHALKEDTDGTR